MPSSKTCLQASLAALLGAIAVLAAAVPVAAQDYPNRPITFIIPLLLIVSMPGAMFFWKNLLLTRLPRPMK